MASAQVARRASAAARPAPRRDAPAPARRPELRVVGAVHRQRRIKVVGALVGLVVFGMLFGLVVFQTVLVQNQNRIDKVDAKITAAQATYQQLRLQAAQLEAPTRIVQEATTRLGMVTPPGTTYLTPSAAEAAAVDAASTSGPADQGADGSWTKVKPFLGAAP